MLYQHSSHTLSASTAASRFHEKSGDRDDVVVRDVATFEELRARINARVAVNRDGGETASTVSNVPRTSRTLRVERLAILLKINTSIR